MLSKTNYEVLIAAEGKRALKFIHESEIDLLITDYRLPTLTGLDLLTEMKNKNPEVLRIMITGYADTDLIIKAINEGEVFRFIKKPWSIDEMTLAISQALELIDIKRESLQLKEELEKYSAMLEEKVAERNKKA
jgi:DNA-binding NtrC family response regulator